MMHLGLREWVLRGPSGGERVVHPCAEVEERDGGGEEGLGLLAGEVPAVGGGGCDRLSDRCRNPFAEWVVVAGLDDGAGVAVDDGADAAEVVAEVDQGSVGDRSVVGGLADYPAGGGQGAVEGQGRRTGLTRGLGGDQDRCLL